MQTTVAALPTLDDLRRHVLKTLCAHDQLEPSETPFFQGLITRSARACGLFFQVQGPRMLKAYAVWAGEEDRILYYDSTGERFGETQLSDGSALAELVALHNAAAKAKRAA
jgi:hypothetical protein